MSRSTTTERASAAILFMCFIPRSCCSSALRFLLSADGASGRARRCVQCDRGANERLQRLLVNRVAFVDVDGAPDITVEARIEEARGIIERGAFGEGQFHDAFVRLAGADDAVMLPHRNAAPLPFLDDFGIGLLDEAADVRQRLAAPIAELLDPSIDQLRRRGGCFRWCRAGFGHWSILFRRFSSWSNRLSQNVDISLVQSTSGASPRGSALSWVWRPWWRSRTKPACFRVPRCVDTGGCQTP